VCISLYFCVNKTVSLDLPSQNAQAPPAPLFFNANGQQVSQILKEYIASHQINFLVLMKRDLLKKERHTVKCQHFFPGAFARVYERLYEKIVCVWVLTK